MSRLLTEQKMRQSESWRHVYKAPVQQPFKLHIMMSLGVLCLTLPVALIEWGPAGSEHVRFVLLAVLLIAYAIGQVRLVRRFHHTRWLVNPAVLWALLGHLLPTISVLLLMTFPPELLWRVGFDDTPTQWWVKYQYLNILGAIGLWTGYWSSLASRLARTVAAAPVLLRLIRAGVRPRIHVIWVLVAIAVGSRLLAIKLGVFGYASSYDALIAAAAYTQYLSMVSDLGKVALIAASLVYFYDPRQSTLLLVGFIFLLETTFGILSGFKSAVVVPTLIVGICYYVQRGRVPRWLGPATLVMVFVAYALVDPFRIERHQDSGFDGTSLYAIVDAFGHASSGEMLSAGGESGLAFNYTMARLLARRSDVSSAVHGIQYADQMDTLPPGSPNFLRDIFLSPLYAYIPRVIWDGKPIQNLGLWYTHVVVGKRSVMSSTAMYPVTYLNFAGGVVAVVIGFFIIGILQSALFRGLLAIGGSAVFTIVCMIGFIGHVDSVFYSYFISLLRFIPMLLIVQWFLFRPARK